MSPRLCALLNGVLLLPSAEAFAVVARAPMMSHRRPFSQMLAGDADGNDQPLVADTPAATPAAEQVDLVDRAQDPFRVVRVVLYATFGITGLAGVLISATKMGSEPSKALSDLAINAAVLAGGVGIFFFDRSVTAKLREKAEKELANPVRGTSLTLTHARGRGRKSCASHGSLPLCPALSTPVVLNPRAFVRSYASPQYLKGDALVSDEEEEV